MIKAQPLYEYVVDQESLISDIKITTEGVMAYCKDTSNVFVMKSGTWTLWNSMSAGGSTGPTGPSGGPTGPTGAGSTGRTGPSGTGATGPTGAMGNAAEIDGGFPNSSYSAVTPIDGGTV